MDGRTDGCSHIRILVRYFICQKNSQESEKYPTSTIQTDICLEIQRRLQWCIGQYGRTPLASKNQDHSRRQVVRDVALPLFRNYVDIPCESNAADSPHIIFRPFFISSSEKCRLLQSIG